MYQPKGKKKPLMLIKEIEIENKEQPRASPA
jgi:hypothetical protein